MPGPPDKWFTIDVDDLSTSQFATDLATAYAAGYQMDPTKPPFVIGSYVSLTGYLPASSLSQFSVLDQSAFSNPTAWDNALAAEYSNGFTFQFIVGTWSVLAK